MRRNPDCRCRYPAAHRRPDRNQTCGPSGHRVATKPYWQVICFSLPDGASRKDLAQAVVQRQQPDPERLHEKEVLFLCQTIQLLRLFRADGKGLFAQNVLALLQAELAVFVVQGVGGGDIDQLNVRVGQHGVIVGVDLRDAELLCQRLAGGLLPGADRLTAERRDLCKLCRHRAGDGASAEDADIHGSAPPYI